MRNSFRRLQRDERGMTFVLVGLGFMAFMAATTLAVDVGMMMTARAQAQNAADAGALSGAVALAFNDYNNRTATGPAVQSAISAATTNHMMGSSPQVLPTDVTFPTGPTGQANRIKVDVFRTTARGNPIPTLIGPIFGTPTASIHASATAEVSPANAMRCVKPFMIPDKWHEMNGNNQFDLNTDIYIPAGRTGYTGYTVANDVGMPLVLRAGTGDQPEPSFYYSWKMSNDIGGDFYRENIANCNQEVVVYDADHPKYLTQEPGNKAGPTLQGIKDLIDKDPNATWDSRCKCVKNSAYTGQSPRVFPIPLFNPQYYAEGKANGRVADFMLANFLGFFADYVESNGKIHGIITTIVGQVDPNGAPAPPGMFGVAIRLVQ
jgi:Flp pilus assembly protein TadG